MKHSEPEKQEVLAFLINCLNERILEKSNKGNSKRVQY